jgi:formate dehydrogenase (NADP+) beta subunit
MGVECHFGHEVTSMKSMLDMGFDAYFVGTGAPRGRDLDLPGRPRRRPHLHRHRLAVERGLRHTTKIEGKVIVMGGGNTAMDCCRTAKRLGAESVTWWCAPAFEVMKASEWEKEDAMGEGIPSSTTAAEGVRRRERQAQGHRSSA